MAYSITMAVVAPFSGQLSDKIGSEILCFIGLSIVTAALLILSTLGLNSSLGVYIYLCYGMHWLLNIVTGEENHPEAVLIRACVEAKGPGKLTKVLGITGEENRSNVVTSEYLWIGDDGFQCEVETDKRVGIGYASQEDQDRLWRFILEESPAADSEC